MEGEPIVAIKASKLNPAKMIFLFTLKLMHLLWRILPYLAIRYGKFTLKLPLCLFDKKLRGSLLFRPFIWSDVYAMYEEYIVGIYEGLRKIKPGDVVVDVGAYIGDFTLKACSKVGERGKVIAFEPSPEEYNILKWNVDASLFGNCLLYNIACGCNKGNQTLYLSASDQHNPSSKSLVNKSGMDAHVRGTTSVVSTHRLDDICKNAGITHVDFLKIDTEGYGLKVLKGAEGLLKNGTYIAMEIHLPAERGVSDYLSKLGYKQVVSFGSPWTGILYAFRSD